MRFIGKKNMDPIGLLHLFGDITEAQRLANRFKNARKAKLETELINSISLEIA